MKFDHYTPEPTRMDRVLDLADKISLVMSWVLFVFMVIYGVWYFTQ
ncbi:MAG TPA: hypothetical protein VJH22_02905 [Candidatus Nanoarchaeia archaeon]|nr:hypothetical protein [Candidatus Nanoarchaeia archaeon]